MILNIEVTTKRDIPDLVDKALGRIYTIDGVEDVRLTEGGAGIDELEQENRLLRARNDRQAAERAAVIDEVADALLKFKGAFGHDTVQSFAIYVRGLK